MALDGALAQAPAIPQFHDVTVVSTKKLASAKVMGVPPEEFGIERSARDIKTANYCFHEVVTKTKSDLISEGFDEDQIMALTPYTGMTDLETNERDTVQEHQYATSDLNPAAAVVRYTEHYVRMDYEGTGRPCLYQVITGGDQGDILKKDGEDAITPFDAIPFAAASPIPMTHRFFGKSIADMVEEIQRQKTALKRGALDNMYSILEPRIELPEKAANSNTIDDLLVSRKGAIIRTAGVGGMLKPFVTPDISASVFQFSQYLDAELETRTGISKQSQGIDADALQNQSATAVAQVFSASQMRVKLIARVLGEGVRDIFSLLHATIRKHGQQSETVKLRNAWIDVDPRGWKTREHMTINVGLGNGGKAQQFAQTMAIANVQEKMVGAGMTNIVTPTELYNTATELTKIMGHKNPNRFFKDPDAKDPKTGQLLNPPPPSKPDPKTAAIQAQSQATMQEQAQKSQLNQADAQLQAQLKQFETTLDAKLKILQAHIDAIGEVRAAHHDNERHKLDVAHSIVGIATTAHAHDTAMVQKAADHQAAQDAPKPQDNA